MMIVYLILIFVAFALVAISTYHHQCLLRDRAQMMRDAIRFHDFTRFSHRQSDCNWLCTTQSRLHFTLHQLNNVTYSFFIHRIFSFFKIFGKSTENGRIIPILISIEQKIILYLTYNQIYMNL